MAAKHMTANGRKSVCSVVGRAINLVYDEKDVTCFRCLDLLRNEEERARIAVTLSRNEEGAKYAPQMVQGLSAKLRHILLERQREYAKGMQEFMDVLDEVEAIEGVSPPLEWVQ